MSETPNASPYITTNELAAIIRKRPEAVRMMRSRGTGPKGTRFGRDVLYLRADVRAWLEEQRDTNPRLFYRPEVQAWLANPQRQITATAARPAASYTTRPRPPRPNRKARGCG